ncbi:MAG: MtaA/CmuA family methyltransferase [Candidatus Methylarchaceae archaeon HK02M1]|nr:MtaA/CmuA family methyltransferase [Candidatus Methylarchaceae archaeon HK02M1]
MKEFSPKRRAFAALLGGEVDRPPVTSLAGCGGTVNLDIQKASGIMFPEAHRDPEKMAKLAIAAYEMTGIENVRVPFDFVIEPEAMGCKIKWPDNPILVPATIEHIYKKPEDLKMPENLLETGRIPVLLEAIRILRKEVGDFLPISSLALGPFTLAGELAGTAELMMMIMRNPENVKKFVEFSTEFIIEFAKAQYRAGADIVQIGDPTASGDLISPKMFQEYAKPALTRVADELKGIRLLHICGNATPMIKDVVECGYDGISIEEAVDISKVKPIAGDVKILGNVSSKGHMVMGTPEQVKEETLKALDAGVDLLEPGCGVSLPAPLDNVKAMVEAVKEWSAKKK